MDIGKQIAKYRKEKHITQEQLGETVGVTNRTVSKWEAGVSSPGIDLIPPIAAALGVSLDQLFGIGSDEKEDDLPELIRKAVSDAVEDELPCALEDALEQLLPRYLNAYQGVTGYSLSVWNKDKGEVFSFYGTGEVAEHYDVSFPPLFYSVTGEEMKEIEQMKEAEEILKKKKVEAYWYIKIDQPDADLSVGHYDSKEEAKADLKRLVDAYANRLPTIEL